jgi:4-hydroxy-tetrahydrodipicolinate synthase
MIPKATVKLWSALPTPLTDDYKVDESAVVRLINDAIGSGMSGVFLAGTCGEGPWLQDAERSRLIETAAATAAGRLSIAAQVSDNSVPRILDNIKLVTRAGADVAIVAAPTTFMNPTPERVVALFRETAANSNLPVGIYDLGKHRAIMIPEEYLLETYMLPNVSLVKDSSGSPARRAIALEALTQKPDLQLFNGDEFKCLEYLENGYQGCMFGGAVAVPAELRQIASLFTSRNIEEARRVESAMQRVLYGIYGGIKIECWLTGLKYHLVRRGLFNSTSSFLGYPLTDSCRTCIEEDVAARMGV